MAVALYSPVFTTELQTKTNKNATERKCTGRPPKIKSNSTIWLVSVHARLSLSLSLGVHICLMNFECRIFVDDRVCKCERVRSVYFSQRNGTLNEVHSNQSSVCDAVIWCEFQRFSFSFLLFVTSCLAVIGIPIRLLGHRKFATV